MEEKIRYNESSIKGFIELLRENKICPTDFKKHIIKEFPLLPEETINELLVKYLLNIGIDKQ